MQMELESFVEKENYFQAFQLLPEYLQILENYSGLSSVQEMGRGIEAWLARTIQKLDTHLLGVCQTFHEESYLTVSISIVVFPREPLIGLVVREVLVIYLLC
jgi:hypothetical protein